jgi:alpha-L-rhamnosidase
MQPRFSWKIESSGRNVMQTTYSLQVASDANFSSNTIVWQTGKVQSDQSVLVAYNGAVLKSEDQYYWRVRIWDNKGRDSKWSEIKFYEMGFLLKTDWKAKWIGMENDTIRFAASRISERS